MNTSQIQANGAKRPIDGFDSLRHGVSLPEDLYRFILRSKVRIVSILSIIKHNGLSEFVAEGKFPRPSVHDSDSGGPCEPSESESGRYTSHFMI